MLTEKKKSVNISVLKFDYYLSHCLAINLLQIDLVPPEVVIAWRQYFKSKFEHLRVVCFTSFPTGPMNYCFSILDGSCAKYENVVNSATPKWQDLVIPGLSKSICSLSII